MSEKQAENLIVWQKWYDPLGEDDLENMQRENGLVDELEPEFYEENILAEDTDGDHDDENNFYSRPTKVIMTPMGIIPYTDNTASNKIFNFWTGHTNFNITPYVGVIIEQTEGIETLDIFTRYRFRIGVGKLFDAKSVMLDVNDRVYNFLNDQK